MLNKTFGCVRFFWNKCVESFNSYENGELKIPFKNTTEIRKEFSWMSEISYTAVQQKERDFQQFKNQFFNKKRKIKLNKPKFKKKSSKQSFRLSNNLFKIQKNKIKIQKVGWVKLVIDRKIPEDSKILSFTISKNPSNQYFVSICVEQEIKKLPKTNKSVGIDVGLTKFLTQSDNIFVENPRYFRNNQSKLKRIQRYLSRKKKGSHRWNKCRLKVARLHQKISNQRDNFLHNESIRIVKDYDNIYVEDLNVFGMIKNRKLSKSISDVSWSKFISQLEYKSFWYGKNLVKIGRFEPSSKTCNNCGWVNKDLKLSNREFICQECGCIEDRDLNAAKNIEAMGVNIAIRTLSECKTDESLLKLANHGEVFRTSLSL